MVADGGEEAIKAPAAAETGAGDDGTEAVEEGTPAAKESVSRPGALKPLEDPQVKEVMEDGLAATYGRVGWSVVFMPSISSLRLGVFVCVHQRVPMGVLGDGDKWWKVS